MSTYSSTISGDRPEEVERIQRAIDSAPRPPDQWQPGDLGRLVWNDALSRYETWVADPETGELELDLDGKPVRAAWEDWAFAVKDLTPPDHDEPEAAVPDGTPQDVGERSSGVDAADLLAMDLPELRMVVPGLVPEGTTVLASPPKVGKSCLVYQMAVEVAIGGALFGERVTSGSVLYLALEDGQRRGQARLRAALDGRTMPRGRLEVRWSAPPIGEGLEEALRGWLDSHPDAALVAIDTLQKVRQASSGKRGQYEVDVDDLGRLQSLFRDRPVALLIVHHSRKEAGDDFLASVSGTYGITGSVDTIIVIRRKRLEAFGTIVATGREIPEAEVSVHFDGMTWTQAPDAIGEASFERMEVYRTIQESGPLFPAAIATRLGLSRTSVQNMVTKLASSGAVYRTSQGYQALNPLSPPDDCSDSESHRSHQGHTREEWDPETAKDDDA